MNEKSQVLIRDVPKKVIEKLDEIAKNEGYSSRNQMLVELLERYTTVKDDIYYQTIPSIIHSICKDEIGNLNELSEATIHTMALASQKLLKVAQRLDEYLVDDPQAQAEYREIDELVEQLNNGK